MYTIIIWSARISTVQKLACQREVFRTAMLWASLRVRQVLSGRLSLAVERFGRRDEGC
jgi:hypothetical protein